MLLGAIITFYFILRTGMFKCLEQNVSKCKFMSTCLKVKKHNHFGYIDNIIVSYLG